MTRWQRWLRIPQDVWLRKVLFQIHLWTGIGIGLYIVLISVTGGVLVYRNELYRAFEPERGGPLPVGYRFTTWLLDLHDNLLAGETGPSINGAEWYDAGAQRHRMTFNGIWQLPYAFQVSGLYIYGDNGLATATSGVDVLQTGGAAGRVRPNGTLIPRNGFDLGSLSRLDMRVQRRFTLRGVSLDGIVEVFNVLNRVNYGTWVTNEANARYRLPSDNNNIAYKPRLLQLGFRAAF